MAETPQAMWRDGFQGTSTNDQQLRCGGGGTKGSQITVQRLIGRIAMSSQRGWCSISSRYARGRTLHKCIGHSDVRTIRGGGDTSHRRSHMASCTRSHGICGGSGRKAHGDRYRRWGTNDRASLLQRAILKRERRRYMSAACHTEMARHIGRLERAPLLGPLIQGQEWNVGTVRSI